MSITARPGDDPGAGNSILAPYKPGGVLSLYLSDGLEAGLPRPRIDGRPVPWITPIGPDRLPEWRKVDPLRVLACQTDWLCQVFFSWLAAVPFDDHRPSGQTRPGR